MKSIFEKAVREEILARIAMLQPGNRPKWGKMTVGQMVRHCTICEEYYYGNVSVPRSLLGRIVGQMAIRSLLKEQAAFPRNSRTPRPFHVTAEIINLEVEKRKWQALIERYADYDVDHFTHWFFGKLSHQQLGQLIYKHGDHHLSQFSC